MLLPGKRLLFSELVPSGSKEDKVMTLIPLLHLAHVDHGNIELRQNEPFGEIEVVLKDRIPPPSKKESLQGDQAAGSNSGTE